MYSFVDRMMTVGLQTKFNMTGQARKGVSKRGFEKTSLYTVVQGTDGVNNTVIQGGISAPYFH